MVFKEKLRATLIGLLIAAVILVAIGFTNAAVEGTYAVDSKDFTTVIECGAEVSLEGLKIVDNRTLGLFKKDVSDDMIVSVSDTSTAGRKEIVISHGGKEYVIHFDVKYRVDFVADGVTVASQLVNDSSELVLPDAPKVKTGYKFSHWDINSVGEITDNVTVNAVYTEIDYPALDIYTATYGDTLAAVQLGSNEYGYWEFVDSIDTPVGEVGRNEHAVRFVYYSDSTVNKYDYAVITVGKRAYDFVGVVDEFYYDGEVHTPYVEGVETVYAGGANVLPGVYQYSLEIVDDNYFGVLTGTYEIKKPTVTVTVSSDVIAYPAPVPQFTFEVEGFDNVDLLGIEISAPDFATQIGEYEIGITYTNEYVNFIIHKGTLTVIKGDLAVDIPEIGEVTFEDKLADIPFPDKYLGTWEWESPETVVDSMDGITAYAIFTHDDPNLNPFRVAVNITNVSKKTLYFNVTESDFVYEAGKEHSIVYEIVGGRYPELYATLTVSGNDPVVDAGTYRRTLVINDSRYEGTLTVELNVAKATPTVDFAAVYETVWQENLRLESIILPDGYTWQNPAYRITEAGERAYAVTYTPEDTDNYLTVSGEITVKVAKAEVTVAGILDSYSKTYDTYKFDIRNSGIAAYYTDGELIVQYYKDGVLVDEITDAGEYVLVVTVSEGKNYLGTTVTRTVTVTPALNVQSVLTQQNAVYLGGLSSLVLPENVEGTWSWRERDLGAAGVKTMTAVFTPDAKGNYLPREVEVTVTVAKRTVDAPEVSLILYYNAQIQNLGIANNGIYSIEDYGGKDVGTYTAILTISDKDNYQWASGSDVLTLTYTVLPVDNAFTYLPEDGASFPYLSSLSSLTATAKFGGVKVEYKKAGEPDSEFSRTLPTDVGEYVVRFTTTDTNCNALITETRAFSITPIEVIPAPSIVDATLEYNGNKQTAQLKDVTEGIYTVTDSGATNAGDIGTVTLTIYNANYVWADGSRVLTLTYEIVKGGNSWVSEPYVSSEITYGDTPTLGGEAEFDSLAVYHRTMGSDAEFIPGLPTDAGVYEIMFTTTGVNAQKAEEKFATITVKQREIEIPTANDSLVYNGGEQIGVPSPTVSDALFGIYTVTGGTATAAGNYSATALILNPNYKWQGTDEESVEIAYSVKKAAGVITTDKSAYEFIYSGEDLFDLVKNAGSDNTEQNEFTYAVTSFVRFDGTEVSTDSVMMAGRYVITVSTRETANYLGASVTVSVTVKKAAVTVPAEADKVYTGGDIEVSLKDTELYTVTGDTVASNVGTYSLTFTLRDRDNYEWLGNEANVAVTRYYSIGTALNSWTKEPQNITAVYNGKSVTVNAEALHGTVTVVYTLGGIVVDAPVGAGIYNATVTAVAENYTELVAHVTVVIEKAKVAAPAVGELIFNGYEQTLTLASKDLGVLYTVIANTSGTKAGETVSATLALTDPYNYKWQATDEARLTVSAVIGKADILFDGAPAVNNWAYGDAETLPVSNVTASQTHFAGLVIEYLYRYESAGEFVTYAELSKTNGRLNAGRYTVKAVVSDSADWNGCESQEATFTVVKQGVTIPTASNSVFDGRLHTSGLTSCAVYTVLDEGGAASGTYYAYLTLTDTVNYEWVGESTANVTLSYSIEKLTFTESLLDNSGKSAEYGTAPELSATVVADVVGVDFSAYITYLYSSDGESWYESVTALAESFGSVNLNTGTYLVKTVLADSSDWYGCERVDAFSVTKKVIALPTPATLTYNGTEQSALVPTDTYTVSGGSAVAVGNYTATLTLLDPANYKWQGTELDSIEIGYSVAKAKNSWATVPAISSTAVTYKDGYTVSGAPLYDTLKYKYRPVGDDEYILINSLSELPTAAGSYEIVLYTESVNAEPISATFYLTVVRKTVDKPTSLQSFVYDGNVKTHGIAAADGLVVRSSVNATNAGESVSVTLGLLDSNYVWSDGTTADYTLNATVQKAAVTFGTVTVPELVYTELPAPTVSVDKAFASSLVTYRYSVDKVNYYTIAELTVGGYLPAGSYWVKACVESANISYSESIAVSFTVERATPDSISVSWGTSPSDGGLYYQNLLALNEKGTGVTFRGVKVEALSYTFKLKDAFAGINTVYTVTVTPKDSDNFTAASFDVTVPLKTVATIGHGGTPYGTIKDAVENAASGKVVWVVADTTGNVVINENLTIPAGVTLRLPYGSGSSDYNSNQKSTLTYDEHKLDAPAETNSAEYRKTYVRLTAGVILTVNGTLEISGELSGGGYSATYQDYAGHTARYYALLEMETGATLDINGTVYALGYIRETEEGKSAVYVNAGGSLNQPFVMRDFRTGNYMKAASDNKEYAPFTRFILMNVSPVTTIYAGGKVVGYANLYAGSMHNNATGTVVGSDSSAFVQLSTGRLVSKYNIDTEVMDLHFYGGAVLNEFKLSGGLIVGQLSSKDYPLAISYHLNIILDREVGQTGDAVYTIGKNGESYKMLPGARITVEEGVIFNVSKLNVYNGDFVEDIKKVNKSDYSQIISTIKCYPTDKGDAILTVRGTLIAETLGGKVHTDTDGAKIFVSKSVSASNREITKFYEDTLSSTAVDDVVVTNKLQLYYDGVLVRNQVIVNVEYTSSAADKTWNYVTPEIVEVQLQDGYGVYTDFAVYTDESGEIYLGTFDSRATKDNPTSIKVLKGATVTFYLTKHQLFSETAASKVTVSSLDDIHSSDYTKDWSATSTSPVIYTVKAISVSGTGIGKLNSVSIVYDLTSGSVSVTLKSSSSGLSSGSPFTVNGTSASSSGWLFKSYTYTATLTADTTLNVV